MYTLWGLSVYSPKGAHGLKPTVVYNERAGAKASMVPVSRLTR